MGRDDTVRRADSATSQDAANPAVVEFGEVRTGDTENAVPGSDRTAKAVERPLAALLDAGMFTSS